jgi:hypothetical protein
MSLIFSLITGAHLSRERGDAEASCTAQWWPKQGLPKGRAAPPLLDHTVQVELFDIELSSGH